MSESYFELFFQSYKYEKDLTEFINVYNCLCSAIKKRGNRFFTINDVNGFYFDTKKLVYSVNNGKRIDLKDYVGARIEVEIKLICNIIFLVSYSVIGIVYDNIYDVVFPEEYWARIFDYFKKNLKKLYNKYYIDMSIEIKEFEKELDALIYEMLSTVNNNTNIFAQIYGNGNLLPHTRGDKCGAEYTAKLIKNLNCTAKKKYNMGSMQMFEQNVDEFLMALKRRKQYSSLQADYLKYLCIEFARGRKVKKNDIPDYAMVTSLDKLDEKFENLKSEETVFVTFDNFVNSFCLEKGIMYREDVYKMLIV